MYSHISQLNRTMNFSGSATWYACAGPRVPSKRPAVKYYATYSTPGTTASAVARAAGAFVCRQMYKYLPVLFLGALPGKLVKASRKSDVAPWPLENVEECDDSLFPMLLSTLVPKRALAAGQENLKF